MVNLIQPPNDSRNFVHKRLFGAAKSFVTSGFSPTAAAIGFATSGGRRPRGGARRAPSPFIPRPQFPSDPTFGLLTARRPPPRSTTARPGRFSAAEKAQGRALKFPSFGAPAPSAFSPVKEGCIFPWKPNPVTGRCELFAGDRPGRDTSPLPTGPGVAVGDAIMGRYGAAYRPGSQIVDRAVCLPGDVVANDGLCYPKASVTNKQRAWPRGRRPLLTGGEMRAISTAARAGRRLELAQKRLQKIGLMKKPAPRRKMLSSGPTEHHHHPSNG